MIQLISFIRLGSVSLSSIHISHTSQSMHIQELCPAAFKAVEYIYLKLSINILNICISEASLAVYLRVFLVTNDACLMDYLE